MLADMRPRLCLVFLLALLATSPARAADPGALERAWATVADREGWHALLSPAFPQHWPPPSDGSGGVVSYAFAWRYAAAGPNLVEVSAPWAGLATARDGSTHIEVLRPTLLPLGVEATRPMRGEEVTLAAREAEVARVLRTVPTPSGSALIRAATCAWIARHGLVAEVVLHRHPEFGAWLRCGVR
jgi:hypothetical protein